MALIILENRLEVAEWVVIYVFGDPVPNGAVESSQLATVLLAVAVAAAGTLSQAGGGAIGLFGCDISRGIGGGGAV